MGKGDKKTKRGKLFQGSYGKKRRRKKDEIKAQLKKKVVKDQDIKPVKERKPAPPKETKIPKEKPAAKETKPIKESAAKETKAVKEPAKPKKEKKS